MKTLKVDRRTRSFVSDERLADRIETQARVVLDARIALAKLLLEMKTNRGYIEYGCSSVEHFARRIGYEKHETRRLIQLAESMKAAPVVEDRLQARSISVSKAIELAPVVTEPTLFPEKDDWLQRAQDDTFSALRKNARLRLAEVRSGRAVVALTLHADDEALEAFDRAHVLASRKAEKWLTRDETFKTVCTFYVEKNDTLVQSERTRRVGDTARIKDSRYIPIAVKREVRRTHADRCQYPGCWNHGFLHFAHRRPHSAGGSRESRNILLLCNEHHFQQEIGLIVPIGPSRDPMWIWAQEFIMTHDSPGGHSPQTDREKRAMAALRKRRRAEDLAAAAAAAESDDDDVSSASN